ncbi:hypothetical protein RFI_02599 [Reticulomyxa filosa]|uniref:Uncharacterized protein n=1 Tax=Reticulomyxa filosa TaxID=46433 RepID=X6P8W0_RETFI|nr:hypothetical protein RFI_02599 [Reticulomyxa filosa]|eukprot:ETO34494.1 hypothetical protein RFI_02599 [Reticulomyxa filosa]
MLELQKRVGHKEMLLFLRRLKLLVHRKKNEDPDLPAECQWYVKYNEALICLCSVVVGPELHRNNDTVTHESMRIERWYAETFECLDVLDQIIKQGSNFRAKSLAVQITTLPPIAQVQESNTLPLSDIGGLSHQNSIELVTLKEVEPVAELNAAANTTATVTFNEDGVDADDVAATATSAAEMPQEVPSTKNNKSFENEKCAPTSEHQPQPTLQLNTDIELSTHTDPNKSDIE